MDETEYLKLLRYIKHFNIHFSILLRRDKRFKEINSTNNNDTDVITYLDMIIVQLRAMCIGKKDTNIIILPRYYFVE